MDRKEAIEILEHYQLWRSGEVDDMKYKPRQITEALDVVLIEVKKEAPTDEYCDHSGNEILCQGDGYTYKICADCGEDI